MWNMIFLVTGAIFVVLLIVVFFSKEVINTKENSLFKWILISNAIGYLIEIPLQLIVRNLGVNNTLVDILCRAYLISITINYTLFTMYVFVICLNRENTNYDKHIKLSKNILQFIEIIIIFLLFALPFNKYYDFSKMYIYGTALDLLKLCIVGHMAIYFVLLTKNFKHLKNKKYLPIYFVILLLVLMTILNSIDPSILITNMIVTFICYTMYFTIENPDVQMMEELYRNKKLIEKSNEDTSNFLFRMTQDIKRPVKDIIDVSTDMFQIKDLKEINEGTKIINNKAKELDYLINDALDVSSMSTKTLKIYDSRYNVSNLFKEIKYQAENNLNENVKFEYSISNNIPEYLYGDSIKLKQAVYSVIENSIKNTKEGSISLDISSIVKYDICRLIITITDTGEGIGIEEVNSILSLNIEDLSKINLSSDKVSLNLKEIKKLVMYMSGNLIVRSDEGKGTTVSITLDQKIVENKNKEITRKLDLYEESLHKDRRIMIVDDDAKELSKITNYLEKYDINVSGSLFGRDVIEKISNNHKLDLIILDDETDTISAYEVLKELKKNNKFNTPVVIMIDDNKEFIKLHYLQDGFADVILKSKLNDELDRIMKRF